MTLHLGNVPAGITLYIPFATYDGATGASEACSGLAVTDIEIYKNGSTTQRSSDAGYTLLDTDGIDFDTLVGINGFSVDLSNDTDAGFFSVGGFYWVVVSSITVDAVTVNFIAATFRIIAAEHTAGYVVSTIKDGTGTGEIDTTSGGVLVAAIAANAITATAIATGAITNAKFAAGAIDAAAIADAAIDAATFAASAITATAIAADAITAAKVADGTIDAATFATGAITAAKFAAGAIDAAAIADGAIDAATFAAGAITATAIASDAITDAKVASDVTIASVTGAVGSVTGAVGSVTGNVGGNVTGSVGSVATGGIAAASFAAGAITASAIAADAIGASELAADAVAEIQSGLATASALDTVDNFLDTEIAAIKAKTDSLTFTVAGQVDANIQYVNDVQITGTGQTGTEWGPA